jgi:hypothetical protein
MKKHSYLTFLFGLIVMMGCDPIPDKSISEPLSPEDLFKIFEKDTSFKATYEFIETANKLVLNTDVKKAEYLALTYRDFHNFYQVANNNSAEYARLDSLYGAQWEEELSSYDPKIDSLSKYWKDYLSKTNVSAYAKIDYKNHVEYKSNGIRNRIGLVFKIEVDPVVKLENLKFRYDALTTEEGADFIYNELIGVEKLYSGSTHHVKGPIEGSLEVEVQIRLQNRDDWPIWIAFMEGSNKYIFASIEELKINGGIVSNSVDQVPFYLRELWLAQNKDEADEILRSLLISSALDEEFESRSGYFLKKMREHLFTIDSLSASYWYKILDLVSKRN